MSDPYQPIQCGHYDIFEFACLKQQPLALLLIDGQVLEGTALGLSIKDSCEWLSLEPTKDQPVLIRLDKIASVSYTDSAGVKRTQSLSNA